jgi:CHAT domain-containing protein
MVDFYKHLLDGMSYAQALRQAKLNMIAKASTAAPRSWSSFVLMGAE